MSENIKVCIVGVGGAGGGLARLALEAMAKAGIVVELVTTKETLTKAEKSFEITKLPIADFIGEYDSEPIPGTKKWRIENKKRY